MYPAATDGPAYYVSKNIPGKTMLKGKTLIWSRKGAKAGTIMPKDPSVPYDLTFLKYYIEGQLKKERQSISNHAQLSYLPDNQKEIGDIIRQMNKS